MAIPGIQGRRWKLTIEFRAEAGQQVIHQTRDIDWAKPWFRLSGARTPVPAFAPRPHSLLFTPGTWYQIEIKFA
jgi:hypothetical protein